MNDSGVQFHEEGPQFKRKEFYGQKPGFGAKLAKLVMQLSGGLIKTEQQAYYVILGFVVLAIIISLVLIFGGGGGGSKSPPKEEIFRVTPPSTPISPYEKF